MKRYRGTRSQVAGGGLVWVERIEDGAPVADEPLTLHARHSPDGHNWGYSGSGPSQLALDILWDHLGAEPAPTAYQIFKRDHIAPIVGDSWYIDEVVVANWVEAARLGGNSVTCDEHEALMMLGAQIDLVDDSLPCWNCDERLTYVMPGGWLHPDGDAIVRRCRACGRRMAPHEVTESHCRCGGIITNDHVATPRRS